MRISDWSSDVCSSDLDHRRRRPLPQHRRVGLAEGRLAGLLCPYPLTLPPVPRERDQQWRSPRGVADIQRSPGNQYVVAGVTLRSEEHTSELQSLIRNQYAVFCLNKKNN